MADVCSLVVAIGSVLFLPAESRRWPQSQPPALLSIRATHVLLKKLTARWQGAPVAGIVRDPAAERREQMTPEYGSDAGQNDVQLPQYAQHSRRVDFRLRGSVRRFPVPSWTGQQQQRSQESNGHITAPAAAATVHGGRFEPIQPVVPIVYLTILVVFVDT